MNTRDDPKATQKLIDHPIPRRGPAQSPFAGGKVELLSNPEFRDFRDNRMKRPRTAARHIRDHPECVGYAAELLTDRDTGMSIEAGEALLWAVKMDVDVMQAMPALKKALLYDGNDQVRLFAARIFHNMALKGYDISDAYMVLQSAYEKDSYEQVRLTAENALIAAGRRPL